MSIGSSSSPSSGGGLPSSAFFANFCLVSGASGNQISPFFANVHCMVSLRRFVSLCFFVDWLVPGASVNMRKPDVATIVRRPMPVAFERVRIKRIRSVKYCVDHLGSSYSATSRIAAHEAEPFALTVRLRKVSIVRIAQRDVFFASTQYASPRAT